MVETKGTLVADALRPTEKAKIKCGKAHFDALGTDIVMEVADSYGSFEAAFQST